MVLWGSHLKKYLVDRNKLIGQADVGQEDGDEEECRLFLVFGSDQQPLIWFLDNGGSNHITGQKWVFFHTLIRPRGCKLRWGMVRTTGA
ncbi:hypothetical protein L1987_14700 [Smallanthus sonchifolius]|uniref:Uncharacterized protein n=1 Tax=Smallanthus sonchifolius TaxID=185202 RepID=A0ACB9J3M0_9ASTR|nr:hypothetical protein L1987_14700 [Smallanthus sonchifolius]